MDWRFPSDVDGWLTEEEGRALAELARGRVVLEIGSYCGRSTICMAQTATMVHAVDTFDGRGTPNPAPTLDVFKKNLSRFDVAGRVTVHVGTSKEAILADGIDGAFIDGAHGFHSVMADVGVAIKVLKPGGWVAFHDYRKFPGEYDGRWDEGVTRAVDSLLERGAKLLSRHGSIAVVQPGALRLADVKSNGAAKPDERPLVALSMPRRGREIADDASAEGFYRFPCRRCQVAAMIKPVSTVLPYSFNQAWCGALNLRDSGVDIRYLAVIHDDIGPAPWWVDTLVDELERLDADVVSTVFPIKSELGLTTTAVYTGDLWLPRRLTMTEVHELPETFGEDDLEGPPLLGSGLFVADITKPWVDSICFDFMNRIRRTSGGERVPEFIPEDWLFSHQAHEAGAKLFATRKVKVEHSGTSDYPNDRPWGSWKTDEVYRQRNATKKEQLCASNS